MPLVSLKVSCVKGGPPPVTLDEPLKPRAKTEYDFAPWTVEYCANETGDAAFRVVPGRELARPVDDGRLDLHRLRRGAERGGGRQRGTDGDQRDDGDADSDARRVTHSACQPPAGAGYSATSARA